ncbi:MAG: hypothetical protein ABI901_04285 [Roseiflexaceae bacterium]
MIDSQTYGAWQDMAGVTTLSYQRMTLDAGDLARFWRRCSLSSDFWSRYSALFVPATAPSGQLSRAALESVLAYLLNELFENCAKFGGGPVGMVRYQAWIQADSMTFQLTNHIQPEQRAAFIHFIRELLENDPDELYFRRLEENAEANAKGSGLGYLTLIKDYGIRFGFRFIAIDDQRVAVEVQAHVSMKEI